MQTKSEWNGYAILREALRSESWICAGEAIRNGGTRTVDATLREFGYERVGRSVIERAASNTDATMVFVPCVEEDDIDTKWVVLLGLNDLRMLPYSIFETEENAA